jgi:hypothetical protein
MAETPRATTRVTDAVDQEGRDDRYYENEARVWALVRRVCLVSPIVAIFVVSAVSAALNWSRHDQMRKGQLWSRASCLVVGKRIGNNSVLSNTLTGAIHVAYRGEVLVRDYGLSPVTVVSAYLSSSDAYTLAISEVKDALTSIVVGQCLDTRKWKNPCASRYDLRNMSRH